MERTSRLGVRAKKRGSACGAREKFLRGKLTSVELFTGVGGLAMGVSRAGFEHLAVVERDHDSCETIRENQRRWLMPVAKWPLYEMDVRAFDYADAGLVAEGEVDLLAGGPPCQPFSLGGKHKGHQDERDMFPEVVRAVRELKPQAILIENVKGLMRESFTTYFEYIRLQLSYPDISRHDDETWMDHRARLEQHHTAGKSMGLMYRVVCQLLNAANYGVPQRRERVIIVGFREDVGAEWSFLLPTHSQDALLVDQWVTGEYWDRHKVASSERPDLPERMRTRVQQLRGGVLPIVGMPWRTVRDTIGDLPDPTARDWSSEVPNHWLNPGARSYPGHTGSAYDEPAKTLKAGDHGVPGGENTLAYRDGSLRYFTVRESARMQTFPDEYVFHGSWTESMRQLGNAVPVTLAHTVAGGIAQVLTDLPRSVSRSAR